MRRIVSAKIRFLSLVPRGANQFPTIYKSDSDDTVTISSLVKATDDFDEQGELLSVVYAPEVEDSQGDIASAEVIKEMMQGAAKDGFDLDIRHDGQALSKQDAFVAESFLIQKNDPRFADFKNYQGESVDVTGGWATVIKIENKDLRKAYREGEWDGVSMAGDGVFATEKQDVDGFLEKLAALMKNNPSDGDLDMDRKELESILKERDEKLTSSIVAEVTKALKPEPTKKEGEAEGEGEGESTVSKAECPVKKPVLKSATDPKALAAYQKELTAYSLAKDVDWEDPEAVAAYAKAVAESGEEISDEDANVEKEDSEEVADLKRKLAKAQRSSNVTEEGNGPNKPSKTTSASGISKEDADLLEAGRKAGQEHSKARG